jgi:hypothetical protein
MRSAQLGMRHTTQGELLVVCYCLEWADVEPPSGESMRS